MQQRHVGTAAAPRSGSGQQRERARVARRRPRGPRPASGGGGSSSRRTRASRACSVEPTEPAGDAAGADPGERGGQHVPLPPDAGPVVGDHLDQPARRRSGPRRGPTQPRQRGRPGGEREDHQVVPLGEVGVLVGEHGVELVVVAAGSSAPVVTTTRDRAPGRQYAAAAGWSIDPRAERRATAVLTRSTSSRWRRRDRQVRQVDRRGDPEQPAEQRQPAHRPASRRESPSPALGSPRQVRAATPASAPGRSPPSGATLSASTAPTAASPAASPSACQRTSAARGSRSPSAPRSSAHGAGPSSRTARAVSATTVTTTASARRGGARHGGRRRRVDGGPARAAQRLAEGALQRRGLVRA